VKAIKCLLQTFRCVMSCRPVRITVLTLATLVCTPAWAQDTWPLNDAVGAAGGRAASGRIVVIDQVGGFGGAFLRRIAAPPVSPRHQDALAAVTTHTRPAVQESDRLGGGCGAGAGAGSIAALAAFAFGRGRRR
jgi:hypothetical protein